MTISFMTAGFFSGWEFFLGGLLLVWLFVGLMRSRTERKEFLNEVAQLLNLKYSKRFWPRRFQLAGTYKHTRISICEGRIKGTRNHFESDVAATLDVHIDFSDLGEIPFSVVLATSTQLGLLTAAKGLGPRVKTGDERFDYLYGFYGEELQLMAALTAPVRSAILTVEPLDSIKNDGLHFNVIIQYISAATLTGHVESSLSLINTLLERQTQPIWVLLAHSAAEDASVGFRRKCLTLLGEYFPTKPETVEAAKRCVESDDPALKEIASDLLKA